MRKLIVLIAAVALLVTAASSLAVTTRNVKIGDDFFSPTSMTVRKNDTVKWRWTGDSLHTVTVSKGPVKFSSTAKRTGTYSKKMTRTGTYRILCSIHPDTQKMRIVVR